MQGFGQGERQWHKAMSLAAAAVAAIKCQRSSPEENCKPQLLVATDKVAAEQLRDCGRPHKCIMTSTLFFQATTWACSCRFLLSLACARSPSIIASIAYPVTDTPELHPHQAANSPKVKLM